MSSSCLEPKTSLKLVDVLEAMRQRDELAEVVAYQFFVTALLESVHGISPEDAFEMPFDTVIELMSLPSLPPKPLKYSNWDGFWWGEAAFERSRG